MRRLAGLAAVPLLLMTACTQTEPEPSIDLGPGETQDEQVDELDIFVESMSMYLGEDHTFRDSEVDEWSREHYADNRRPTAAADCAEGYHRHKVVFEYSGLDAEQAYSDAEDLGRNLGFTPNEAVNNDASDGDRMNYTATSEEGRSLIVRQQRENDDDIEVIYRTPCSDDPSLQQVIDDRVDEGLQDELEDVDL